MKNTFAKAAASLFFVALISSPSSDRTGGKMTKRFLTLISLCFTLLITGAAYCAGEHYVVSYTNGRNDVGFFDLIDNGTTFQRGQRSFFTSSARIGTTSPEIICEGGEGVDLCEFKVKIHHTFAASNGLPIYGIAKFHWRTGQLEPPLVPVTAFGIGRFDVLNIFTGRILNSKRNTNDISSALLNPTTGAPGARKSVFNNVNAGDVVFGATISRDGRAAVQGLAKLQGPAFVNQIRTRTVLDGGGTGTPNVISSGVATYTPSITTRRALGAFRLLAYRVFRNIGTPTQQSQILTQQLNETTLQPIGVAKQFTNFANAPQFGPETTHSVALAEDGRFMIYTRYNPACKKQIMVIQRLGPRTGNKIGPPKILFGCSSLANIPVGYYGIDVEEFRFGDFI